METVRAPFPRPEPPSPQPQGRQWLDGLLASADAGLRARGLCARSRAIYLARIRHLVTTSGQHPGSFGEEDLRDYLVRLEVRSGLSDATLQQVRSILRFLFRDVVRRPALVRSLSGREVRTTPTAAPITRAEALALIDSAPALRDRVLVGLLFGSGLRLGEALALRVGDLDRNRRTVRIRSARTRAERLTVLPVRIERELNRFVAGRPPEEPLFPGADGAPLTARAAQRALERAARRSGIWPRGGARDLRRGFQAELVRAGVHPAGVHALLGLVTGGKGLAAGALPPGVKSPL